MNAVITEPKHAKTTYKRLQKNTKIIDQSKLIHWPCNEYGRGCKLRVCYNCGYTHIAMSRFYPFSNSMALFFVNMFAVYICLI